MAEGKKYFWLKLKRDFFKRHDIQIIEAMPNGKDYILFYLKLLCESVDHEGKLRFSEQIPYNEQMLATITNTNVDVVRSAIEAFTQLHMMEMLDDGTYFMNEVDKMIGSTSQDEYTRESTRLRVQRYRERQKTLPDKEKRYSNVTCNGEIEKEIDIELEKDIDKDIYGEAQNVLLTKEEYQKIKDKGLTELIEELSLYMASKKKTYVDHYATILAWAKRREQEKKTESGTDSKNQFNRFKQRDDYDIAELERKLIKN